MAEQDARLKLSVAMAVIRNKPGGMTGQEYARQLADRIKARQLQWKRRCQDAESEILNLKQQLVLQKQIVGSSSELSSTQKSEGRFTNITDPFPLSATLKIM